VWVMIATPIAELRARAERISRRVGAAATVAEMAASVGGGSLPGEALPSIGLAVRSPSADRLLARLRTCGRHPVIGRIEHDRVLLDLRTVQPDQDRPLAATLRVALAAER
jgi:L-seryl-tRNA(Ser) seleniumtransferase